MRASQGEAAIGNARENRGEEGGFLEKKSALRKAPIVSKKGGQLKKKIGSGKKDAESPRPQGWRVGKEMKSSSLRQFEQIGLCGPGYQKSNERP